MTRKPFPPTRWFSQCALPLALTLGGAVAISGPSAKAAADEAPSGEPADAPSGSSTEETPAGSGSTAAKTSTSGSDESEGAAPVKHASQPKAALPDEERPPAEPPEPPPPHTEPIPATVVTGGQAPAPSIPAPYVEHLGPDSFPGRLRGLYGGSLWLEPSFTGLQWPYMAHTGVGVSGSFWVDSGYETIKRDQQQLPNSRMYFQQGRGVLRLTPTYARGLFFVQGQAELVGNLCQTANVANVVCNNGTFSTDDLWIRVGQWNRWDLKVGRFEAWEVYHLGLGLDPYTLGRLGAGNFGVATFTTPALEVPPLYAANSLHDRPTDGLAVGYAALHAYLTDFLRVELLAKLGTDNYRSDNSSGDTPSTYVGGRPTAILDVGWFKFRIGAEYQKRTPTTQTVQPGMPGQKEDAVAEVVQKGVVGSVQFVIDPIVEFGLNGAISNQHQTDAFGRELPEGTFTTKSVGGFANVRLADLWLAGVGANWTAQTDSYLAANSTVNDYTSQLLGFAALQYLLAGQLFIKAEFALARAYFQPSDLTVPTWSNYMYNGTIRLMYLY